MNALWQWNQPKHQLSLWWFCFCVAILLLSLLLLLNRWVPQVLASQGSRNNLVSTANQSSARDSGMFAMAAAQTCVPVTLVAQNSLWSYLDNGSDQGTAWRERSFNDQSWATGAAELGYGDVQVTSVGFGPDPLNKYITTYLRKNFTINDPSIYPALQVDLLRDDGAIVYLNGVELVRSNMPSSVVGYTTLAASTIDLEAETTFFSYSVSAAALVAGANVLAVEVHQRNLTSSDISFNLHCRLPPEQPHQPIPQHRRLYPHQPTHRQTHRQTQLYPQTT